MSWLYDSHIHLSDSEYDSQLPYIIDMMKSIRAKACCVSVDYETSKKTLAISEKNPLVLPFIGLHPEKADETIETILELIQTNSEKLSGIGEIGMDKTYCSSNEDFKKQESVFRSQLSLAEKLKKPISVHSRKSLDEVFEILSSYSLKGGVLLHWFEGRKSKLQKAMDLGFFVSFGPLMIYSEDKQVLLSKTDLDKFLIETDGPVRFSRCFELKPAQISFLSSVVFCASKVLGKTYDDLVSILEKNSKNYLGV